MDILTNLMRAPTRRLRETAYLLVTFFVAQVLVTAISIGTSSGAILPLSVLLFLGLLTAMERVARFEVHRANWMLGTDFRVVDGWFGTPFFSWAGVRERIGSIRSWMAILYAFISFAYSALAVACAVLIVGGGFILAIAAGWLPRTGDLAISLDDVSLRLAGIRVEVPTLATWDLSRVADFRIPAVIAAAVVVFAMWGWTRLARAQANAVEGYLSGTRLPFFEQQVARFRSRERVSERQVREAIAREPVREQVGDLSRRELEILSLMAQGRSNAGIAKTLYITEGSVEKHISNILSKLELPVEQDSHRRVLAVLAYLGIDQSVR